MSSKTYTLIVECGFNHTLFGFGEDLEAAKADAVAHGADMARFGEDDGFYALTVTPITAALSIEAAAYVSEAPDFADVLGLDFYDGPADLVTTGPHMVNVGSLALSVTFGTDGSVEVSDSNLFGVTIRRLDLSGWEVEIDDGRKVVAHQDTVADAVQAFYAEHMSAEEYAAGFEV